MSTGRIHHLPSFREPGAKIDPIHGRRTTFGLYRAFGTAAYRSIVPYLGWLVEDVSVDDIWQAGAIRTSVLLERTAMNRERMCHGEPAFKVLETRGGDFRG